jgi:hypothetical protein
VVADNIAMTGLVAGRSRILMLPLPTRIVHVS